MFDAAETSNEGKKMFNQNTNRSCRNCGAKCDIGKSRSIQWVHLVKLLRERNREREEWEIGKKTGVERADRDGE